MVVEIIDYPRKISVIGYSGSGKSTLLGFFIKEISKEKMNVVIVDTTSKFSENKGIRYTGKLKCKNNNPNSLCLKIQTEEGLERLLKNINDQDNKKIFLIVDEIDQYTDTHSLLPETRLFFQQGRNYKHGGVFVVRQVGRLNKDILSNSQYLFLFKIFNKNDLMYLNSITGMNLQDMIIGLGAHDFFIIDLVNTKVIGKYILKNKNKIVEVE
jgi:hypothetical protein